jgi:hypothetical protein
MKNLISYLFTKDPEITLYCKFYTIFGILIIPVAFLHEFYHLIFVWLFKVKHVLTDFEILKFHRTEKLLQVFLMSYEIEDNLNPYKLIIIGAAPYIGIFGNILLYFAICVIFSLGPWVFSIFLLYHLLSLVTILPSDEDEECIKRGIKKIKEIKKAKKVT